MQNARAKAGINRRIVPGCDVLDMTEGIYQRIVEKMWIKNVKTVGIAKIV
jgi:hypothetical protein